MKKKYLFVFTMLLAIFITSIGATSVYVRYENGNTKENDELKIVTSFYPMYIAALNVVGDANNVKLENLSEPQIGCLHDFQLTPDDMKLLSTADAFIINGGGIEGFMSDVAAAYPTLRVVDTTRNITFIEEEDEDEGDSHGEETDSHVEHEDEEHESHEDSHEDEDTHDSHEEHDHGQNVHVWMSISDYRSQVQAIAKNLEGIDPDNAAVYEKNAKVYDQKLAKLQEEQEELMQKIQGENIIIFHEAYEYVAKDYGLNVIYCMDLDEERQISAGEVADVLTVAKENGVKYILAEELYGKSMGDTVEKESDIKVIYINPLNRGDYDKDSYIDGMRKNIEILKEALD